MPTVGVKGIEIISMFIHPMTRHLMCEERTERFVVKILPSAELRSRTSDKHEAKKFVKLHNIIMVFPTGIFDAGEIVGSSLLQ